MSLPVRPTAYAGWASGPSGYVVQPIAADKAQGFLPTGIARSSYYNWLQNANYSFQKYCDDMLGAQAFGPGTDGSHILDGVTGAPNWATGPTSGAYLAVRNLFLGDLMLTGIARVDANGFAIKGAGELNTLGASSTYGKVTANGGAGGTGSILVAGGAAPGAGAGWGTRGGGATGGTGGGASGSFVGSYGGNLINALGGQGGTGAWRNINTANGGTCVPPPANAGSPYDSLQRFGLLQGATGPTGAIFQLSFAGGAGGGGGDLGTVSANANGGGGGGGGGVLDLAFRVLRLGGATDIQAAGGAGGAGYGMSGGAASGGHWGGGGGGGGGGVVGLLYQQSNILTFNAALCAPGGIGGTGWTSGSTGLAGAFYNLSPPGAGSIL